MELELEGMGAETQLCLVYSHLTRGEEEDPIPLSVPYFYKPILYFLFDQRGLLLVCFLSSFSLLLLLLKSERRDFLLKLRLFIFFKYCLLVNFKQL